MELLTEPLDEKKAKKMIEIPGEGPSGDPSAGLSGGPSGGPSGFERGRAPQRPPRQGPMPKDSRHFGPRPQQPEFHFGGRRSCLTKEGQARYLAMICNWAEEGHFKFKENKTEFETIKKEIAEETEIFNGVAKAQAGLNQLFKSGTIDLKQKNPHLHKFLLVSNDFAAMGTTRA